MIKKITTTFFTILICSMVIMQPLQVAQANHTPHIELECPGQGQNCDPQKPSERRQWPHKTTLGCQIGVSLLYYLWGLFGFALAPDGAGVDAATHKLIAKLSGAASKGGGQLGTVYSFVDWGLANFQDDEKLSTAFVGIGVAISAFLIIIALLVVFYGGHSGIQLLYNLVSPVLFVANWFLLGVCPPMIFDPKTHSTGEAVTGQPKIQSTTLTIEEHYFNGTVTPDTILQQCYNSTKMNVEQIHTGWSVPPYPERISPIWQNNGFIELPGRDGAWGPDISENHPKFLYVPNFENLAFWGITILHNIPSSDPAAGGLLADSLSVDGQPGEQGMVVNKLSNIEIDTTHPEVHQQVLGIPAKNKVWYDSEVKFKVGTTTLEYDVFQRLTEPSLANSRNFITQEIKVEEQTPPYLVVPDRDEDGNPDPVHLEVDFPFGALIPFNMEERIKNHVDTIDDCTPITITTNWEEVIDEHQTSDEINGVDVSLLAKGRYFVEVYSDDIFGNRNQTIVPVDVDDNTPPDVFPVGSIGVVLPAGASQLNLRDTPLDPPPVFDAGTIFPMIECSVEEIPCDQVTLGIGTSFVEWTVSDANGNVQDPLIQEVVVKSFDSNNTPAAESTESPIKIALGVPTKITINATDIDGDKLELFLTDIPSGGVIEQTIESIFKQRFLLTGILKDPTSIIIKKSGDVLVFDAGNKRILELTPEGDIINIFSTHGWTPNTMVVPNPWLPQNEDKIKIADFTENKIVEFDIVSTDDGDALNFVSEKYFGGLDLVYPQSVYEHNKVCPTSASCTSIDSGYVIIDQKNDGRAVLVGGNPLSVIATQDLSTLTTQDGTNFVPSGSTQFGKNLALLPGSYGTDEQNPFLTPYSSIISDWQNQKLLINTSPIFDGDPKVIDGKIFEIPLDPFFEETTIVQTGVEFPRGISDFRLYMDDDNDGTFTKISEIDTADQSFVEFGSPITSQKFRAEFVQHPQSAFSTGIIAGVPLGPRVIELDGFATATGAEENLDPVITDLWDVNHVDGADPSTINSPSGILGGWSPNDIFGAQNSLGQAIFADYQPAGTVHSVEWETKNPVTIGSYRLHAEADGFNDAPGDRKLTGPQGITISQQHLPEVGSLKNTSVEVTTDKWNIEHIDIDPDYSPLISDSDIDAMFGDSFGDDFTTFADGFNHVVEWETDDKITLKSYHLTARHDADISEQGFDEFKLYAFNGETTPNRYDLISTFSPTDPFNPTGGTASNLLHLSQNVVPVTAQKFKAEFISNSGTGPRIVELDGFEDFIDETVTADNQILNKGQFIIDVFDAVSGKLVTIAIDLLSDTQPVFFEVQSDQLFGANISHFVDIDGIDSDSQGNLYVFDNDSIYKFNIAGLLLNKTNYDGLLPESEERHLFIDKNDDLHFTLQDIIPSACPTSDSTCGITSCPLGQFLNTDGACFTPEAIDIKFNTKLQKGTETPITLANLGKVVYDSSGNPAFSQGAKAQLNSDFTVQKDLCEDQVCPSTTVHDSAIDSDDNYFLLSSEGIFKYDDTGDFVEILPISTIPDLWDVANGANYLDVTSTSGLHPFGFNGRDMFGDRIGPREKGNVIFNDRNAGYLHSIEWEVNPPITLTKTSGEWNSPIDDTYTATYTVSDKDVRVSQVTVTASGAQDLAGNLQEEDDSILGTNNPFGIDTLDIETVSDSSSLLISSAAPLATDTVNPTVTTTLSDSIISDADIPGTFSVIATFNEVMDTEFIPSVSFNVTTSTTLSSPTDASDWNVEGTVYTTVYDLLDGDIARTVIAASVSGAQDLAGNIQNTDGELSTLPERTFVVDTVTPLLVQVSTSDDFISEADTGDGKTFTVTANFNEAMDTAFPPTFSFSPDVENGEPLTVESYTLLGWAEGQNFRSFSKFVLYVFDETLDRFRQISQIDIPTLPFVNELISENLIEPAIGKKFKAEFQQTGSSTGGPRIIELNAFDEKLEEGMIFPVSELFNGYRLEIDALDNLYVIDIPSTTPIIKKFSQDGEFLGFITSDELDRAATTDPDLFESEKISISSFKDIFYLSEGPPFFRIHVFRTDALERVDNDSFSFIYTSSKEGLQTLEFEAYDLFTRSTPAQVVIDAVDDEIGPTLRLASDAHNEITTTLDNISFEYLPTKLSTQTKLEIFGHRNYLANLIVQNYLNVYEQETNKKFPDKLLPILEENAKLVAKNNYVYAPKDKHVAAFEPEKSTITHPLLSSKSSDKVQSVDWAFEQRPTSETFSPVIEDSDVIKVDHTFSPDSCIGVDIAIEQTLDDISKNAYIPGLLELVEATDIFDDEPTFTYDFPAYLVPGDNFVMVTATDDSGNPSFCNQKIVAHDMTDPTIVPPTMISGDHVDLEPSTTPFRFILDLPFPQVNDLDDTAIVQTRTTSDPEPISDEDLWDVNNDDVGIEVFPSLEYSQFEVEDMFGASNGSRENGNMIFRDLPKGTTYTVVWKTLEAVTLRSYSFHSQSDSVSPLHRGVETLTLSALNDDGEFEQISHVTADSGSEIGKIFRNVKPVTADTFKIDLTNTNQGPRILELDGFDYHRQICNTDEDGTYLCTIEIDGNVDTISKVTLTNNAPSDGFEVGVTPVTWTATDLGGRSIDVDQLVEITDTIPPEFLVPDEIVIEDICIGGRVVDYEVPPAFDLGGLLQDTQCTPAPGSTIEIGGDVAKCTAQDKSTSPNITEKYFNIAMPERDNNLNGVQDCLEPCFLDCMPPSSAASLAVSTESLSASDLSMVLNDGNLGGETSVKIESRGDQQLKIRDGHGVEGIHIAATDGGYGINNDFDCERSDGTIFRGIKDDGIVDDCFDAEGLLNTGFEERIDEDGNDGTPGNLPNFDDDGDGLKDEDPGVHIGEEPSKILACSDSAMMTLDEGDAVSITCGSVRVGAIGGTVDVSIKLDEETTLNTKLDAPNFLTVDQEEFFVSADANNLDDAVIEIEGKEFTISPGIFATIKINPVKVTNQKIEIHKFATTFSFEDSKNTEEVILPADSILSTIDVQPNIKNPKINLENLVTLHPSTGLPQVMLNHQLKVNSLTSDIPVEVTFPTDVTISGNTEWPGIINLPTVKSKTSVPPPPAAPGTTNTVTSVIELGFDSDELVFDIPVQIKLAGKAGEIVAYTRDGVTKEITSTCTGNTLDDNLILGRNADCKISEGDDMYVWTKHFTLFSTSKSSSAPSSSSSSRSSGGGGGGGAVGISTGASQGEGFGGTIQPFKLYQVNYDVCDKGTATIVVGSRGDTLPDITTQTSLQRAKTATLAAEQPYEEFNSINPGYDRYLFEADLGILEPGADFFYITINAVSGRDIIRDKETVKVDSCQGTKTFSSYARSDILGAGGILNDAGPNDEQKLFVAPKTLQTDKSLTGSFQGTSYELSYSLESGSIKKIDVDELSATLILTLENILRGDLSISLPNGLIENPDTVWIDGNLIETFDSSSKEGYVTLTIPLNEGITEVAIMGTTVIPEFGATAALILIILMAGIIAITRKANQGILRSFN